MKKVNKHYLVVILLGVAGYVHAQKYEHSVHNNACNRWQTPMILNDSSQLKRERTVAQIELLQDFTGDMMKYRRCDSSYTTHIRNIIEQAPDLYRMPTLRDYASVYYVDDVPIDVQPSMSVTVTITEVGILQGKRKGPSMSFVCMDEDDNAFFGEVDSETHYTEVRLEGILSVLDRSTCREIHGLVETYTLKKLSSEYFLSGDSTSIPIGYHELVATGSNLDIIDPETVVMEAQYGLLKKLLAEFYRGSLRRIIKKRHLRQTINQVD